MLLVGIDVVVIFATAIIVLVVTSGICIKFGMNEEQYNIVLGTSAITSTIILVAYIVVTALLNMACS